MNRNIEMEYARFKKMKAIFELTLKSEIRQSQRLLEWQSEQIFAEGKIILHKMSLAREIQNEVFKKAFNL